MDIPPAFIRTVTITIPREREADLYAFWEWASARVRQQPGYIRGRLLRDSSGDGRFTEVHEWRGRADSEAYRASEPFREVIGRLVALSETPPLVSGYHVERDEEATSL